MDLIGVELSDAGILAAGGSPPYLLELEAGDVESPGYALAMKKQTLYGRGAMEQARLAPRQVNDRFWSQLSTYPVQGQPIEAANYAEAAFEHLRFLRDRMARPQAAWSIAAPGFLDTSKLGILLGIAREMKLRVAGLVSLPVAALRMTAGHRFVIHMDMHLHGVELCRLVQGDTVKIDKTRVIPEDGLDPLLDGLCRHVAHEFVRATRFDPLHHAATEQQLFLHLLRWLRDGQSEEGGNLEISTGRTAYSLQVLPQMLTEAAAPVRRNMVEAFRAMMAEPGTSSERVSVQVSHRAARVPGLLAELRGVPGAEVEVLPAGAGAFGALALAADAAPSGDSAAVTFVVSRKHVASAPPVQEISRQDDVPPVPPPIVPRAKEEPAEPPHRATDLGRETPTHVLVGYRAYELSAEPRSGASGGHPAWPVSLYLRAGRCIMEPTGQGTVLLDGQAVSAVMEVRAGQTLECAEPPLRLTMIVVGSGNAP